MASDEIINEIWEIAQENSLNTIDKNEFGRDLRKTVFAELERSTEGVIYDINNEFARALPIILHQAKANPDLIYENNGKGFSVASGILAKAVLTVKYENRFIPGTVEYQKEFQKESITEIVFTVAIIDKMIENYDKLSFEERSIIIDRWSELTGNQKRKVFESQKNALLDDPNLSEEQREGFTNTYENLDRVSVLQDNMSGVDPEVQRKIQTEIFYELYEMDEEFRQRYQKYVDDGEPGYQIYERYMNDIDNDVNVFVFNVNQYLGHRVGLDFEAYGKVRMQLKNLATVFAKVYERNGIAIDDTTRNSQNYMKTIMYGKMKTEEAAERTVFPENDIDAGEIPGISGTFNIINQFRTPVISVQNASKTSGVSSDLTVDEIDNVQEEILKKNSNAIITMIQNLSEDEVADLFGDELKDLLRQKAEELGVSDDDKKTLEIMLASKDDDSFADLFYDDREGFLQELEKMSLLQHAKKQPVTDQEYEPTYRANAEEMVVDSKGLYKAQTDYKKYNEYDGTGTGEGSDASTTGTTVVQDNDTLEVDTINTHQPATNSFINTARREDTDKDGKDLKDERDGGGLEDLPPENDLPDNAAPNNSAKNANFISAAKNMRATTDVMQEMGNITTIKVKEMDKKQDGPEVGDESDTIQPGEIE